MVALRSTRSLPGCLPLYVGMPVILRLRNLSTDLGVTNGAQGFVRKILTEECPNGLPYAICETFLSRQLVGHSRLSSNVQMGPQKGCE
ncbi:uncharacterized protein BJ212DRAFT_1465471 [Suillus subaureus]|uniref:DNA helicase n=1 Tax=Suillus subaureus TaxID=48587 RepID=A0A9P7E5E3_9AGAM|nr:uncharacterized protein BJ212DRAFT_1465471 [Suillus subaureus]KAG1811783.1 hypothetical protein BJ212DRAFT_1465471 [Suillus subaureus]